MNEKRIASAILIGVFISISVVNLYLIASGSSVFDYSFFMGDFLKAGTISFFIRSQFDFIILNPISETIYHFNASQATMDGPYFEFPISLIISTSNNMTNGGWNYSLYHGDFGIYDNSTFSPNITLDVRVGANTLSVGAWDGLGSNLVKNVHFEVYAHNSSPVINLNNTYLYACEGSPFSFEFNITDLDSYGLYSVNVNPQNPFYGSYGGQIYTSLYLGIIDTKNFDLDKDDVGINNLTISASDLFNTDYENITIEVLEINRIPSITNVGTRTVWNNGNGTLFNQTWEVDDVEDGTLLNGSMNINLTYQNGSVFNLFNISSSGEVLFNVLNTTPLGIYPLRVCVTDNAFVNAHENLTLHCEVNGTNNTVCDDFSLRITDENRPPQIISYYPNITNFSNSTPVSLYFNVTAVDGDVNTIDINWYVNDYLVEQNEFNFSLTYEYFDEFIYSFPCGINGIVNVSAMVTDGVINVSQYWFISLTTGNCFDTPPSGGGGGGGGGLTIPFCVQNWSCYNFGECYNLFDYYDFFDGGGDEQGDDNRQGYGGFNSNDFNLNFMFESYLEQCNQLRYNNTQCGISFRECVDLNHCEENVTDKKMIVFREKPKDITQVCQYVLNPGCYDGIKNCHHNSCEDLVDCGGPCPRCPNCDDGEKNQGEEGIDCGGPCINKCDREAPSGINFVMVILLIFIFIMIILILYALYRILKVIFGKKKYHEKVKNLNTSESRKENIKRLLSNSKRGEKV